MIKLVDGPAAGTYMVKRAPLYLRAVVNDKGGTDALDMPSDTPTDLESIHVYQANRGARLRMTKTKPLEPLTPAQQEHVDASRLSITHNDGFAWGICSICSDRWPCKGWLVATIEARDDQLAKVQQAYETTLKAEEFLADNYREVLDRLDDLLEKGRLTYRMTPEEKEAQRRSFEGATNASAGKGD